MSVTPATHGCIPPASVAEMIDRAPMRAAADLTASTRAPEADRGREFAPVDWIEVAVLASDRHR